MSSSYFLDKSRLFSSSVTGDADAWVPSTYSSTTVDEYVEINLDTSYDVSAIITRGSPFSRKFSHSITVQHSTDGITWSRILDDSGSERVYSANFDDTHAVYVDLQQNITTQYLRVFGRSSDQVTLQLEVVGKPTRGLLTILHAPQD